MNVFLVHHQQFYELFQEVFIPKSGFIDLKLIVVIFEVLSVETEIYL